MNIRNMIQVFSAMIGLTIIIAGVVMVLTGDRTNGMLAMIFGTQAVMAGGMRWNWEED